MLSRPCTSSSVSSRRFTAQRCTKRLASRRCVRCRVRGGGFCWFSLIFAWGFCGIDSSSSRIYNVALGSGVVFLCVCEIPFKYTTRVTRYTKKTHATTHTIKTKEKQMDTNIFRVTYKYNIMSIILYRDVRG